MKKKCPFYNPEPVETTACYGKKPGWCTEQDSACARDYLCPSAKLIQKMEKKLKVMRETLKVAKYGLTIGRDFIGAGLDGMTGGEVEHEDIRSCLTAVNKALKIKVNNA